jgi:hypothetical protein
MLARFRSQVHDPIGYPNEHYIPISEPRNSNRQDLSMLTLNVPGRCKEETPINAKRSHYDRMLLDDDTIVAVGTHQWRIGAYHIADGLRLPVDSIERRHGYQRILLPLTLDTAQKPYYCPSKYPHVRAVLP